jgi:hypothetical protein
MRDVLSGARIVRSGGGTSFDREEERVSAPM